MSVSLEVNSWPLIEYLMENSAEKEVAPSTLNVGIKNELGSIMARPSVSG